MTPRCHRCLYSQNMRNTLSELKVVAVEGAFEVAVATNCLTDRGWSVAFVRQYSIRSAMEK